MAMAGFIQWLAKDLDKHRTEFEAESKARRHDLLATASHARTADIGAQLATAWRFLVRFAVECGAIDDAEASAYVERTDRALAVILSEQSDVQGTVDPVERFRALLNGAITSGRAHIANPEGNAPAEAELLGWHQAGGEWQARGRLIGWEDRAGALYLEPEASFAAVQEMGGATGETVGIGSVTLWERLRERGLLISTEKDRNKEHLKVRRTIGGHRRQVLHIKNLIAIPENGAPSAPSGTIREKAQHLNPLVISLALKKVRQVRQKSAGIP